MSRFLTRFRHDLGVQLLAQYLVVVVPVLIAFLVFGQLAGQRIRDEVRASDLSLARAIAAETDLAIQNDLEIVKQLGLYPQVSGADPNGMHTLFSVIASTHPDINLIYRLDARGMMTYHYPEGPGSTVGEDFSFRDYFQRALNSHQPLFSQGRISPTTNQPVATAVMPIWQGDTFEGVVATNIKLESLSQTLATITAGNQVEEGMNIYIIDSAGRIIAHPDPAFLLRIASDLTGNIHLPAFDGFSGSVVEKDPQGDEYIFTYAPMPSANWVVVISRPTTVAFAAQQTLNRITLIAFGAFAIVGLLFWMILARRVIQPIEQLAEFSQSIGRRTARNTHHPDLLEGTAARPDQIGNLVRSIFRMEKDINARINEQSTLLETSKAVLSTLDIQIVLNRILEQVQKLMGVEKAAIVALDEEGGMFRARASRGLSRHYTEQIAIQPDEPQSVTMRALRALEPIQISDTESDPSFVHLRPRARAEGYRAMLAIPLIAKHAPPSALLVYRPEPHVFSEDEIQLLVSFANHAAMSIENAALFARSDMRLQEQTRRLEALIQSMQDGLIMTDLGNNIVYANRRIGELAGMTYSDLIGAPLKRVMSRIVAKTPNRADTNAALEKAFGYAGNAELKLLSGGRSTDIRLQIFDVTDSRGIAIGQGIIIQDITAYRELDRMKSSLISTVSHELRTPLAAIKGYATTLLADDVEWDHSSQREFLNIISGESDRLSDLVNDLLDLSRIEAGNLRLDIREVEIAELLRRAAERAGLSPDNRLTIQPDPQLPTVFADEPRLESIVRNLIENARKYGGDSAEIQVSTTRQGDFLIFRVDDNGPGIPPEKSRRIFESFYRIDDRLSRTVSGAGLGLSICQGFVRAHGGQIWVEPREPGTCIAFSIPLNLRDAPPEQAGIS